MSYIPVASDAAEPVLSRTVESAALEFRTLKARVNAVAGMRVPGFVARAVTAAYTVVSTDSGVIFVCTGTFTLSLAAIATLGANFTFAVEVTSGTVTIDPASAETIDGAATRVLTAGQSLFVLSTGGNFVTFGPLTHPSPYITTLLDDTTAAAAQATLLLGTRSIVASAATPDIWTGTGSLIEFTGSATVTGFAAAPQAGASRLLHCTGTPTFIHSANLLVPGHVSYVASASDLITVTALTTTHFRLEVTRADGAVMRVATNAETAAGTNNVFPVTPLSLRGGLNATGAAPVFACRAWVSFNAAGVINASGNVSSITKGGAGHFQVNFATAMPDTGYVVSGVAASITNHLSVVSFTNPHVVETTRFVVVTGNTGGAGSAGTIYDTPVMTLAVFR